MKKFTCKEMGGPCEEVHEGATAMEIAKQNFAHVTATTDKAHKQMREQNDKTRQGTKQRRVVGVVQQRMGEEKGRGLIIVLVEKMGMPRHFRAGAEALRLDVMVELGRESQRQRFESR